MSGKLSASAQKNLDDGLDFRIVIQNCVASVNLFTTINLSLIHISEPTRRRGISYAVFCLKKKIKFQCILLI